MLQTFAEVVLVGLAVGAIAALIEKQVLNLGIGWRSPSKPDYLCCHDLCIHGCSQVSTGVIIGSKRATTIFHCQSDQVNTPTVSENELYQKLEALFALSSSDMVDDAKDSAVRVRKQRCFRALIKQIKAQAHKVGAIDPVLNSEFRRRTEEKIKLFDLLTECVKEYWESIPSEMRQTLHDIASSLFMLLKVAPLEQSLGKSLYSTYQGSVFRYIYAFSAAAQKEDPDNYLFDIEDGEGQSFCFPVGAEEKAADRVKDVDNKVEWVEFPQSKKKLSREEIRKHMKERGYT